MQGATVLHHGANAGSNVLVTAGMVATVGGLYPPPDAVARIAAARTGRPVPIAHAVPVEVQIRLRDGSVQTVLTRQYADPDAQAVHRSIYQTSIDQAGMRARPQLRSPTNPVLTLYLASVPPTQPIDRIILWKDIPHRLLSMLVPGLVTFNAIEMAEIYPAQFSSVSAAEHAREKWGPNPRASLLRLLNDDPRAWFGIEFQQRGQGRKLQHRYCIEARLTSTIADIKATYDLVCEPRVVCFKAAGEVVPAGFKTPLKESGTTSPCPDPLTSGLLAGYRRSTAETAARASPDG